MKYCGVTLWMLGTAITTFSPRVSIRSAKSTRIMATTVQARAWKPRAPAMMSISRPVPKAISSIGMRPVEVGSIRINSTYSIGIT